MPTPTPTPIDWPTAQPTPQIEIYDNNQLTATSGAELWPWVIGLQWNLTAKTVSGTPISAQWNSSDGGQVLSQTWTNSAAGDTPAPSATSGTNWLFYSTEGDPYTTIVATATVSGQNYAAMATYDVEVPGLENMNAYLNYPDIRSMNCPRLGIASGPRFQLGSCTLPFSESATGMSSWYSASGSPDFGGLYTLNQLVAVAASPDPGTPPDFAITGGAYWLDSCWYFDVDEGGDNRAPASFPPASPVAIGTAYDAPGFVVSPSPPPAGWGNLQSETASDNFKDHFIFNPAGYKNKAAQTVPSIWVTIGEFLWDWGGNVTDQNVQSWQFGNPLPTVSPDSGQNSGSQSTWLPSWSTLYGGFTADQCKSPDAVVQAVPVRELPRTVHRPHLVRRHNMRSGNYVPLGSFQP